MNPSQPRPWDDDLECLALSTVRDTHGLGNPQSEALSLASAWQFDSPDAADAALAGDTDDFVYRRDGHPNERSLAQKLTALHAASRSILTAQGMSALAAVGLCTLRPGSHVWIGHELYGKSTKLFQNNMQTWGVVTHTFDPTDASCLDVLRQRANDDQRVSLVLIETLSNPRLRMPDIPAIAEAVHAQGGLLVVDNTFATHLVCQPLKLGADVVVESLSKQVNGHSDSMLGLLAIRDLELANRMADVVSTFGLASSPMDCFLTHRGLMSLGLRVERACHNALEVSRALSDMPSTLTVDYPGLASHPQHELAKRDLKGGFGWMLSFTVNGLRDDVRSLIGRLSPDIPFVPSLGDICTTLSHPASTSHRGLTAEARAALGIHEGTIRISCGAEPTDWLVQRITAALRS